MVDLGTQSQSGSETEYVWYTEEELYLIRSIISKDIKIDEKAEQRVIASVVKDKAYHGAKEVLTCTHIGPLVTLSTLHPKLHKKIESDPIVRGQFDSLLFQGYLLFLPTIHESIYGYIKEGESPPNIHSVLEDHARGKIAYITVNSNTYVVKPTKHPNEQWETMKISLLRHPKKQRESFGITPRQYPGLDNYIVEECIDFTLFNSGNKKRERVPVSSKYFQPGLEKLLNGSTNSKSHNSAPIHEQASQKLEPPIVIPLEETQDGLFKQYLPSWVLAEQIYPLAMSAGEMLGILHANDVLYNAAVFLDARGRSHVGRKPSSQEKKLGSGYDYFLTDFGYAVPLNSIRRMSDVEIFGLVRDSEEARTLPKDIAWSSEHESIAKEYRNIFSKTPYKTLMKKESAQVREEIERVSKRLFVDLSLCIEAFNTFYEKTINSAKS